MTKVSELQYRRCTLEEVKAGYEAFEASVNKATSAEDVIKARDAFVYVMMEYATYAALSYTRYTLNTRDEFYVGEMNYYNEIEPLASEYQIKYAKLMLNNPFRKELEKLMNPLLFKTWELAEKTMSPEIVAERQEENNLVMEYSQLMSQIQLDFLGEKHPLSYVKNFMFDRNRDIRRQAGESIGRGLGAKKEELDAIFDKLVKCRTAQARKLGYKNFVELGYYRMNRIDYDRDMVEEFERNVLEAIVPVVAKFKKANAEALAIDQVMLYDNDVNTVNGSPKPTIGKDEIFAEAQKMYDEMDKEIGDFMRFMQATEAFDVEARDGKWGGGYCTEFFNFKQPFILANFSNSSEDVNVITHEFGHAYAINEVMKAGDAELSIGGMETAECHSMSMEFLSWPYMEKFFGDKAQDYRKEHILSALTFIPYGVIVDRFQHVVYDNPDLTPDERDAEWNKLEEQYRPYLSTKGIPYLEKGTRWQYQMHIYETPFYYIDYCLAQMVALGFLTLSKKDYHKALEKYKELVKRGGSTPFSELIAKTGIAYPFKEGALEALAEEVQKIVEDLN